MEPATPDDAAEIAALRTAVAEHLTRAHGRGHWSSAATERGVHRALRHSRVLILREAGRIVATLALATKKPWAIDVRYFKPCRRPLYLLDMAVAPHRQQAGIGRRCLDHATTVAQAWPAQAIRLDAYDHAAGAGGFYARCGYTEVGRAAYRGVPLIYYEYLLPDDFREGPPCR